MNELNLKVNPKVSIGFTTVAGMLFALAQYLGAVGTLLANTVTPDSIALFATATATLIATINHRTKQAEAAIHAVGAERAAHPAVQTAALTPIPLNMSEVRERPETNVLYLDGELIAREVVKALNTNALVSSLRGETATATTATETAAAAAETGEQ
jgi:hypothetical protein